MATEVKRVLLSEGEQSDGSVFIRFPSELNGSWVEVKGLEFSCYFFRSDVSRILGCFAPHIRLVTKEQRDLFFDNFLKGLQNIAQGFQDGATELTLAFSEASYLLGRGLIGLRFSDSGSLQGVFLNLLPEMTLPRVGQNSFEETTILKIMDVGGLLTRPTNKDRIIQFMNSLKHGGFEQSVQPPRLLRPRSK